MFQVLLDTRVAARAASATRRVSAESCMRGSPDVSAPGRTPTHASGCEDYPGREVKTGIDAMITNIGSMKPTMSKIADVETVTRLLNFR